jgi:hypothetical protein
MITVKSLGRKYQRKSLARKRRKPKKKEKILDKIILEKEDKGFDEKGAVLLQKP